MLIGKLVFVELCLPITEPEPLVRGSELRRNFHFPPSPSLAVPPPHECLVLLLMASNEEDRKQIALQGFRKKLLEHKEIETRVRSGQLLRTVERVR